MKQKTHKGAKKRIKMPKKGKGKSNVFLKGAIRNSHLKRKDGANTKHRKKRMTQISKGYTKRLKKLINQ